jgi:hypothetical protein
MATTDTDTVPGVAGIKEYIPGSVYDIDPGLVVTILGVVAEGPGPNAL